MQISVFFLDMAWQKYPLHSYPAILHGISLNGYKPIVALI